jgi:hypothetical protein
MLHLQAASTAATAAREAATPGPAGSDAALAQYSRDLAQYTNDLVTNTGRLSWATLALGVATMLLALLVWRGNRLQRRGLRAVETQLGLALQDVRVRRPMLEVEVSFQDSRQVQASVRYIGGTEPAFDVEAWVQNREATYGGKLGAGTITSAASGSRFMIDRIPGEMMQRWPFPEVLQDKPLADSDYWAGVTWRCGDRSTGRYLLRSDHGQLRPLVPSVLTPAP